MGGSDPPAQTLAPPRNPWIVALALTSAVFIFGSIVGASVALAVLWHRAPRALAPQDFPLERMAHEMRRNLNLSPEQADHIEEILIGHRQRMREIHEDTRPRVEAEMESLRAQVETVLTPDQAQRWNSRFDTAWDRWMPPGPGGGMRRHRGGPPGDGMGPGPGPRRGLGGQGRGGGFERRDPPPPHNGMQPPAPPPSGN
jgi:Spy/CpxP family protein refolding chaperone